MHIGRTSAGVHCVSLFIAIVLRRFTTLGVSIWSGTKRPKITFCVIHLDLLFSDGEIYLEQGFGSLFLVYLMQMEDICN